MCGHLSGGESVNALAKFWVFGKGIRNLFSCLVREKRHSDDMDFQKTVIIVIASPTDSFG